MLETFVFWFWEELAKAGSSLFDFNKRVSIFYLVSAFILAFGVFFLRYGKAAPMRVKAYLSLLIWCHSSSRTDFALWIMNRLLFAIVIPVSLTQAVWISWLFFFWQEQGLSDLSFGWTDSVVMIIFTLCYFLMDDFSRFFVHWLMHKIPFLWKFHQVHHSATVLTPFTVFRTHPIEGMLFFFRSLMTQSIVISLFLVLFPYQISLIQVFGVLITTFIFNVLGANLRHSGVALSYGSSIEKWFISPSQHQIHHSKAKCHYDRNFGVVLAIWDRLFGSWHLGSDDQIIQYGTGQKIDSVGALGQWAIPIFEALSLIRDFSLSVFQKHFMVLNQLYKKDRQ